MNIIYSNIQQKDFGFAAGLANNMLSHPYYPGMTSVGEYQSHGEYVSLKATFITNNILEITYTEDK